MSEGRREGEDHPDQQVLIADPGAGKGGACRGCGTYTVPPEPCPSSCGRAEGGERE